MDRQPSSSYPPSPLDLDSPLVAAYCRKTAGSAQMAARAQQIFPSGITHDARYIEPHGIYVERAEGSRKWDIDGNEYVDYPGGHGALLMGHNHPVITQAIADQLGKGTHYGAGHQLEVEWGELIQQLVPCAERVRMTNSGTESTMLALRLARACTGREKVLRLKGHFHGWHDYAAGGFLSRFDGSPARGVPEGAASTVLLSPVNDLPAAAQIMAAHEGQVAAIILEPTGSIWGQVPTTQVFVEGLRQLADQYGALLIFDEVISGFRCAPGGAQEALGVTPDMATLGKIVSGGLTGAAVVGRQEELDGMDFRRTAQAGEEKVFHMGTYNATPPTAAAGLAALQLVQNTDACQRSIAYGDGLIDSLNGMFTEVGVPWISYGTYGGFHVFLNPNGISTSRQRIEAGEHDFATLKAPVKPALSMKLRIGVLLHGVDIQGWPGAPVSAAHTEEDRAQTVAAFRQTIAMLRQEGDLE
ncbi:MAG: aminotransferase class III-fold pyridoxal phosphate-dependent enzyme [Candidatus Latescibacteria bacterium]|nr:aminotransferase class III-fold pyridoxal phosphate-dependent enzyme [Candidatus Latescibacterota bacterium]